MYKSSRQLCSLIWPAAVIHSEQDIAVWKRFEWPYRKKLNSMKNDKKSVTKDPTAKSLIFCPESKRHKIALCIHILILRLYTSLGHCEDQNFWPHFYKT